MNNVTAIATSFSNLTSGSQLPLTIQFGTLPPLLFPPCLPCLSVSPANLSHLVGHPPSSSLTAADLTGHPPSSSSTAADKRRASSQQEASNLPLSNPLLAVPLFSFGAALPSSPPLSARPPAFRLLALHTIGDLWRAWKEGIEGQPAVEALEES